MDNKDPFDLLNEEFTQHDLEMENARNLERIRRKTQLLQEAKAARDREARERELQRQQESDDEDALDEEEEAEEKSGCFGIGFRILLIILLAASMAWLIFMPAGSIGEVREILREKIDDAYSWAAGLLDGDSRDASSDGRISGDKQDVSSGEADRTSLTEDDPMTEQDGVSSGEQADDTSSGALPGDYSITVYRPSQIVIVYDAAGNPARIFSCSSGKSSTPTRLGDYAIRAKYRWRYMVGDCYTQYASSFSNGYLFHSIPYNKKNAATMSDASYDKLGNPASSGCIRLCFRDSKWIYDNCAVGTKVKVIDEAAPAGSIPEIIPERIKDKAHSGWDPTDDSPDNPYNN